MSGGVNFMFDIFSIFFFITFAIVIGGFIFSIVRSARTWNRNNRQPRLTVEAKLVSKRTNVSSHMNAGGDNMSHRHTSTSYYATFEVESGDRIEFRISGEDYGLLAEGDSGKLTFQGTRYLGFERNF